MEDLMAQALAMEREAVERYTDLADMMDTHNNPEVAELFRKMAMYENHHVDQILAEMHWAEDMVEPRGLSSWATLEGPETVPLDEMHYRMHPWHALQLALKAEERAVAFFDTIAREATTDAVRRAAEEMRTEEEEHVALVRAWLGKVPEPEADWHHDPDPPRLID